MVGLGALINQISYRIPDYFLYPNGLYGLLSILGLIIIYLVRPKPIKKVIPSLMFFLKQDKKVFASSFFRMVTRNTLFFIQLFGLLLLSIAAALPYLSEKYSLSVENNVIVLDVSASTQTKYDGSTRFEKEIDIAEKSLGKRNTIILAAGVPEIKAADVSREEARDILSKLKPKDTISNIAEAISFAGEQLINNDGRILVISDFIHTGADPVSVKRLLESRGLVIDFVDVSNEAQNIGIIDMAVSEQSSVVYIKNFNEQKESFKVRIGTEEQDIEILPSSVETLQFVTPPGTTEIELKVKDDLEVDNKAYIQNVGKKTIDVLMITNHEGSNLQYAITSSPKVNFGVTNPPLVTMLSKEVYVVKDVDKEVFLKETVNDLRDEITKGSSLIITYQPGIFEIKWEELMPVSLEGMSNEGSQVKLELVNQFTKDIYFGRVPSYAKTSPKGGTVVIASAEDNSTIVAYTTIGAGKVIYYGIDDQRADFKASTSYPIFWNNMLKFLVGRENINSLNFRTGAIVDQQYYDMVGTYNLKIKSIAVNLLSEEESNVNKESEVEKLKKGSESALFESERPREFDQYFIVAAIAVILFELVFIKVRGDI